MSDYKSAFAGAIPQNYDKYLGPMIFEDYAKDLAKRAVKSKPGAVLETAAGTGICTRALREVLPAQVPITATDLNEPMLDVARTKFVPADNVELQAADAMELPFEKGLFDCVLCQFGVMFFPDKIHSFREVARVLKPGGRFVFNVWDALGHNPIPQTAHALIERLYPQDPPGFYKVPFSYHQQAEIEETLREAGFKTIRFEVLARPCASPSARDVATGLVEGNPVSLEILARGTHSLADVKSLMEEEIASNFGRAPVKSRMQAIAVEAAL